MSEDPQAEIDRLTKKIAQLYEGAEEQKQRIKRLEEAGDKMAELIDGGVFMKYAVQWYEAKEDKP